MNNQKKMMQTFQQYLQEYKDAHFRLVYSYTKNHEDALDVIQTSIEKALKAYQHKKYPEHLNSWFYKVLINTSLDHLKSRKNIIPYEAELMEQTLITYDTYADFDLKHALDQLPTELKTIITLKYFEEMTFTGMSQILGENENTIKTKLYKALKWLKLDMEAKQYERNS